METLAAILAVIVLNLRISLGSMSPFAVLTPPTHAQQTTPPHFFAP